MLIYCDIPLAFHIIMLNWSHVKLASVTIYEQNSISFARDLIPFAWIIISFYRDLIPLARIINSFSRNLIPFARNINSVCTEY